MARLELTARVVLAASVAALTGCGGSAPAPPTETPGDSAQATDGAFVGAAYERAFVFANVDDDSLFLVPWIVGSVERADSVERTATGWVARGGVWDAFYFDRWTTEPSRAPGRVLPHGDLSFVVRDGDAIDGVIFEEGARSLELTLGDVRATWVGPLGETVELLDGALYLADQRIGGTVLDMSRAAAQGGVAGGDWAYLLSGDSALFVFSSATEHGGESEPLYRGWGVVGDATAQWAEIYADLRGSQAFPPARRDVPVEWRFWSPDGGLELVLDAVSSDIRAGEGPGPLLPVRALFEVAGRLETDGGNFEVRGLLVHERR